MTDRIGVDMPDRTCSYGGCTKACHARDLCSAHYQRLKYRSALSPIDRAAKDDVRFAQNTRHLPNGCVEWTGGKIKGYGRFTTRGRTHLAHRWKWEREHGALDPKAHLDHYRYPEHGCIGPACVLHVRPTTARENTLRGSTIAAKHLATTHCPKGHPYDERNTYVTPDGRRDCRRCNADRSTVRRAARKAAQQT